MKMSLRIKLLALCVFLVLISTISISASYYALTKQDKQRESKQRIRIAFDIILDDIYSRLDAYRGRFEDFQQRNTTFGGVAHSYDYDNTLLGKLAYLNSTFGGVAAELKNFGQDTSSERVMFYGPDRRLLAIYTHENQQPSVGGYLISANGKDTYFPLDDRSQLSSMYLNKEPIPDIPFPFNVPVSYLGEIPETIVASLFSKGKALGIRVLAPIYRKEEQVALVVGEIMLTQGMVERYASLSQTAINFFAGGQLSVGTLPLEDQIETATRDAERACEKLQPKDVLFEIIPIHFDNQAYYQGSCALEDSEGKRVGAIHVNLSQDIEQQEIAKLIRSVFIVAGLVSLFAVVFSLVATRSSIRFIQQLIHYIDRIAKGDIPKKITSQCRGEFQQIQHNVNSLIDAMNKVTDVSEKIANGDLSVSVQQRSENDTLMKTLRIMLNSLREVSALSEKIAGGDLSIEVKTRSEKDRLMHALQTMVTQLNSIVLDAKTTAGHIATGSRQINSIAEMVSQGSSQQAAAAEEASSSMEQMVANIRQNADNAKLAETMALESSRETQKGGDAVRETIDAMRKIEERISIIQEISMQTSILSMNATIEAAKAQDYGKGFAVVASEVRNLASRSRIAAEEIEQLVKSCVNISEQAGAILESLVPNSQKTAELVQEINAASSEQYMGAEQVNNAIQQLDQVIQQNAATAEEMAASSEAFTTQVEQLREAMTFFNVKERPAELPTEASAGLMQAIQPFIKTKGANEELVVEVLEAVLSSLKGQTESHTKPVFVHEAHREAQKDKQPSPEEMAQPHPESYGLEMPAQKSGDEKDDEFERF